MIQITLQFKEENGRLKVNVVTPPAPEATKLECQVAHQIYAQVKDLMGKFLRGVGSGAVVEVSTVNCPHCGATNTRKPDSAIVQCSGCQKEFGA